MLHEESISLWIKHLERGDRASTLRLWERYFERLVHLARTKLPRGSRRAFDEEDVALSAFHSLCRGIEAGRFPTLGDRDDLWSLLVVITARKALRRLRGEHAKKRGGGHVHGESVLGGDNPAAILEVVGEEPTPAFAAEVAEESERLLSFLEAPELRALAHMKMEGLPHDAIAESLRCSVRTVERRLGLIRRLWSARASETVIP